MLKQVQHDEEKTKVKKMDSERRLGLI